LYSWTPFQTYRLDSISGLGICILNRCLSDSGTQCSLNATVEDSVEIMKI
jgi:hypothetical protein